MKRIAYNGGYKYQLKETYTEVIEIWQGANEHPCSRPALGHPGRLKTRRPVALPTLVHPVRHPSVEYKRTSLSVSDTRASCPSPINSEYILLDAAGNLTIMKGYAWDGPSGPTFDTLTFMRGSLVHDALYQLMRDGYLDSKVYREPADRILQRICKEDGMWSVRAWWVYQSVRLFADPAADPANKRPVTWAPKGCGER